MIGGQSQSQCVSHASSEDRAFACMQSSGHGLWLHSSSISATHACIHTHTQRDRETEVAEWERQLRGSSRAQAVHQVRDRRASRGRVFGRSDSSSSCASSSSSSSSLALSCSSSSFRESCQSTCQPRLPLPARLALCLCSRSPITHSLTTRGPANITTDCRRRRHRRHRLRPRLVLRRCSCVTGSDFHPHPLGTLTHVPHATPVSFTSRVHLSCETFRQSTN